MNQINEMLWISLRNVFHITLKVIEIDRRPLWMPNVSKIEVIIRESFLD